MPDVAAICNSTLEEFSTWANANRLTINADKTHSMTFSKLSAPECVPDLSINESIIQYVSNIKFLGVTLDANLRYDEHINVICSKVSKSIGVMKHISNYVSTPTLISLYYSLIYPYLIYCNLIWGSTFETHLRPLIILQKRAIRVINKVHYLQHTSPLFFSNKILKLLDIVKYRQAVYMYKNLATHETPSHPYSTRNRGNLIMPFQRLAISLHYLALWLSTIQPPT